MIAMDYVPNSWDAPSRLDEGIFRALVHSPRVRNLTRQYQQGSDSAKRHMPAVCWGCTFKDGKRHASSAESSGIFALDIDHVDPDKVWARIKGREDELDILCVHKTPSGQGLRVVALLQPGLCTIADNQAALAAKIGTTYDAVCYDLSRMFYLAPADYFYYIDYESLFR